VGARRRTIPGRFWRWSLAIALIPICVGISWAVGDLLYRIGRLSQFWIPTVAGAGVWMVVFFGLPKPLWLYVVGHELTHALWAVVCGGKVTRFKASSKGGHVIVTKSNFLIVLSPYFFPLYAVLWVLFFGLGDRLFDWRAWLPWFHFGLGIAYAFHLTLTSYILRLRQPDLDSEGWFLSTMIIWLGNALTLLIALPLLTRVSTLMTAFGWAFQRTGRFLENAARFF